MVSTGTQSKGMLMALDNEGTREGDGGDAIPLTTRAGWMLSHSLTVRE